VFQTLTSTKLRVAVAALYALALLVVGVVHRPLVVQPMAVAIAAAYILPDGTIPDLCLDGHSGSGSERGRALCDACLLTAAPGLETAGAAMPAPSAHASTVSLAADGLEGGRSTYRATSRGPPTRAIA
jgi:hypothetical protein